MSGVINDQYLRDLIHGYRTDKNVILDEIKMLNIDDQKYIMKELIGTLTVGHIHCNGAKFDWSDDFRSICPNSGIVMCMYCKLFICCGNDSDGEPCVNWKLCQICGVVACEECKENYDKYVEDPSDDVCHLCIGCYNKEYNN